MTDPASDAPSLSISGGRLDGRSITLGLSAETILGSGEGSTFRLELGNIDPDHAHVVWDARGVVLSDAGSSTGTYVNGERIGADHVLQDGDRIFLGPPGSKESAKLVVKVPTGAAAEAPLILEPPPHDAGGAAEPIVLDEDPSAMAPATPAIILDPPPPAAAPTPPPARPAPPAAPTPPAPAAKPAEVRKPSKPEYTSDIPSMVPADRVREQISMPPPAPAAARKPPASKSASRFALPPIPRWAVLAVGATVAATSGLVAYRSTQKTPPVLKSVLPPKAEVGATVTITGTGFDSTAERNTVRVGDQVAKVVSASATQIAATIPAVKVTNASADFPVVVESGGARSNGLFLKVYAPPKIAALEPDVAMPGDEVVARGQDLAGQGASVLVAAQPATIVEAGPTTIRFRVPQIPAALGKGVPVAIRVGPETGKPATLLLGRLPLVIEASPARGPAGTRVTVRGRGFDPAPGATTVSFGGAPALVLSATATEIVAAAPGLGAEAQTQAPVAANVQGKPSSGDCLFTVVRPPGSSYVPRYFPAPVEHGGHDHVYVSTELGPTLLLSGPGDAPSTAERAERVAEALNALVEAAVAGKPAALELRDKPAPAVAVAGSPNPVVVATPADAAGYDETAEPAAKGRHSTPPEIAALWAALLQDHLTLFVKFQRPFRVLELSPRGKVLADMYAEATRRGGDASGVPFALVNPLTPSLARSLREMALVLPPPGGAGAARGAAAVEGHWVGTMTEGDTGDRSIDLRLRLDGGKLGGTLTASAGHLTMDIPLREAGYDRGTVRFVAVMGGAPKHFVGALAGDSITGTIHASADAKDAVGRFTLKFTQ